MLLKSCNPSNISIKVNTSIIIFMLVAQVVDKKVCHALKDIIFLEKQIQNHRAMPVI